MGYLSAGMWWLAVFPGLALVAAVMLFDVAGSSLRKLVDPAYAAGIGGGWQRERQKRHAAAHEAVDHGASRCIITTLAARRAMGTATIR